MTPLPAVLGLPLLALVVHDFLHRPTIRRLAVRNIARRKSEAALVVAGSMLDTAIITASFIVGDTFGASVRELARTQLGPVDEVVRVSDPKALAALEAALGASLLATAAPASRASRIRPALALRIAD